MVLIKNWDEDGQNGILTDSVRTVSHFLSPNNFNINTAMAATQFQSFDSNGFTVGNQSSVGGDGAGKADSWSWKSGGAPTATNSAGAGNTPTAGSVKINGSNLGSALAGTIPATRLSANTTTGFSIIGYTGTGSAGTVAHGLAAAPDMVIVKELSGTAQWPVGVIQDPMNFTDYMALDKSNNYGDFNYWNDTPPTASVFSLSGDGDVNGSGDTYIAYCFHSVEGYSKIGKYIARGSDPGPFFYCGFKPAWVLVKNMDTSNSHWWIMDNKRSTYNMDAKVLFPDSGQVEASGRSECDFLSNGIKFRGVVNPESNYSTDRYLVYAIAETPFKTSNAR